MGPSRGLWYRDRAGSNSHRDTASLDVLGGVPLEATAGIVLSRVSIARRSAVSSSDESPRVANHPCRSSLEHRDR